MLNMEFIDEAYDKYTHGFIDVYDHCLSLEESNEKLSSFKEHNLKYETRFIELIRSI